MSNVKEPEDPEQKTIIDKLALFVARNGLEFEKMTKEKQRDNPKFSFLFGDRYYGYYRAQVAAYENDIKQQELQAAQAKAKAAAFAAKAAMMMNQVRVPPPNMLQGSMGQGGSMGQMGLGPPMGQINPGSSMSGSMGQSNMMGPVGSMTQGMPPMGQVGPPMGQQGPPMGQAGPLMGQGGPSMGQAGMSIGQNVPPMGQGGPPMTLPMGPITVPPPMVPPNSMMQTPHIEDPLTWVPPPDMPAPLRMQIQQQLSDIEKQIKQSEQNLAAQHSVMMQQQQVQLDEAVRKAQQEKIDNMAREQNIDLVEFDKVLQPIIESCTKDSISQGKVWIFTHGTDAAKEEVFCKHILRKVTAPGSQFDMKLHLVYLLNDVLHHCIRKKTDSLRRTISSVIVPIFCATATSASEEKQQKLDKQLKNPTVSMAAFQARLITENGSVIQQVSQSIQAKYAQLQKQHNDFVQHLTNQMRAIQINALQQHQATIMAAQGPPMGMPPPHDMNGGYQDNYSYPQPWSYDNSGYNNNGGAGGGQAAGGGTAGYYGYSRPVGNLNEPPPESHWGMAQGQYLPEQDDSQRREGSDEDRCSDSEDEDNAGYVPPPSDHYMNRFKGDDNVFTLLPQCPYYELPAGLMVPLIPIEQHRYKAIDPAILRLPTPQPPTPKLIKAIEAFYALPSHERPRNSEGWEQLGLYEFFKAKSQCKRDAAEAAKEEGGGGGSDGEGVESDEQSDVYVSGDEGGGEKERGGGAKEGETQREKEVREREERRCSRRRFRETPPPITERQSRSPDESARESHTPRRGFGGESPAQTSSSSSRRRSSRSPSPSRGSRSPPYHSSRRGSSSRGRSRDRSRSPPPHSRRSPTPPSFMSLPTVDRNRGLDESNRGHQLLRKMGWGGAGLGSAEQGIQAPIDGGEIRDSSDKYKGVGSHRDMFESFRKSKGAQFVTRMREKALSHEGSSSEPR